MKKLLFITMIFLFAFIPTAALAATDGDEPTGSLHTECKMTQATLIVQGQFLPQGTYFLISKTSGQEVHGYWEATEGKPGLGYSNIFVCQEKGEFKEEVEIEIRFMPLELNLRTRMNPQTYTGDLINTTMEVPIITNNTLNPKTGAHYIVDFVLINQSP